MKSKLIAAGLLAVAFAGTASANCINVTVVCPNGNSAAGIEVCATRSDNAVRVCALTDATGLAVVCVPSADHYNFCVTSSTLPPGTTVSGCQDVLTIEGDNPPLEFMLSGDVCGAPPGQFCWETGGGQIDSDGDGDKDHPCEWTFGGVIYPGCSPRAAGGGNLNIVNHVTGAHFKGENFVVDDCRGVSDKSPKVKVNIIDWHGTGEVTTSAGTVDVTFMGTFRDSHDSGKNADGLYLLVTGPSGVITDFSIGTGPDALFLLSTGNVQIHQTGCGK